MRFFSLVQEFSIGIKRSCSHRTPSAGHCQPTSDLPHESNLVEPALNGEGTGQPVSHHLLARMHVPTSNRVEQCRHSLSHIATTDIQKKAILPYSSSSATGAPVSTPVLLRRTSIHCVCQSTSTD